MKYDTRKRLADGIEFEGSVSVLAALEYGIVAEDMPDDEMASAWRELEYADEEVQKRAYAVSAMLKLEDE